MLLLILNSSPVSLTFLESLTNRDTRFVNFYLKHCSIFVVFFISKKSFDLLHDSALLIDAVT